MLHPALRRLFAIAAGFFIVPFAAILCDFLFTRLSPASFGPRHIPATVTAFAVILVYSQLSNTLGGLVTGLIAPDRRILCATILGAIGVALVIPALLTAMKPYPLWDKLATLALTLPMTTLGGWLATTLRPNAPH